MAVSRMPLVRRLLALLLVLTLAWAGVSTQGDAVAAGGPGGDTQAAPAALPDEGTVAEHHLDDTPAQSAWSGELPPADRLPDAAPLPAPPATGARRGPPPPDRRHPDAPQDSRFKPPRA
ncbi:hypothetical protein LOC51_13465 [Rubrivivax sp. JA1024]|nr:hypothetical protein [Rubrivivax sp. JA1024]